MSNRVVRRKTVIVTVALTANGVFSTNIDVPFNAHDVIVRAWTTSGTFTGGADAVLKLRWVGVGEIFHFEGDQSQTPRNIFNVNRSFIGSQQFECVNTAGALYDCSGADLGFTLEFLEYAQ